MVFKLCLQRTLPTPLKAHNILPIRSFTNYSRNMSPLPKFQTALQISKHGGPEVLEVVHDAPIPEPQEGEILVRNTHAGVNYIDTYFRTGLYPPSQFPYILGREGEGHIVGIGPNTPGYTIGERVAYTGMATQAQYALAHTSNVTKLPEGLPAGIGAASMIQGLTALTLIRESHHVKAGDSVLVHAAAGGVGLWLCQLLRAVGAGQIIATASTQEKLELAKKNGATHLINYVEEDWVQKVKELGGVIAVFDGVGKSTFEGDLEVLNRKGTLVSFGNASGAVPPFSIAKLSQKNLKVLRPTLFNYLATKEEFETYANELVNLIKDKKVEVKIHKEYALADAQQAHKDIEGRGTTGKLIFKL